jgi:RNA polymerase sigma-70 factor (ECF subfamily)
MYEARPDTPFAARKEPDSQDTSRQISDGVVLTFASVYEQYFPFVWSMARHFGVEVTEMDDVVQDVFIAVHGQLGTLRQPSALRSWIYTIVKRTSYSYLRNRRTLAVANSEQEECAFDEIDWMTPLREAERTEQLQMVRKLLDALDEPKREVIILVELEELTIPEVASMTGVSVNTLYSRLRTARMELEEAFRRYVAQSQRPVRPISKCDYK